MKRSNIFIMLLLAFMLILAACGKANDDNDNNGNNDEVNNNNEIENEENDDENDNNNDDNNGNEEQALESELDFATLLTDVEEITEGTTSVLYEETTAEIHEEAEYAVTLDGYVVAELKDAHMNFSIPLGDSDEGAVLITHHTIENKSANEIAYTPLFSLKYSGADRHPGLNKDMIPEDIQLRSKLHVDNKYAIPAGETVQGYSLFVLRTVDVENIKDVGFAQLETPNAGDEYIPDNYEFNEKIGSQVDMKIYVSDDSKAVGGEQEKFYVDRTSTKNMGTKTMVKEKTDINETDTLGNSNITLDGYQFTEFEPNDAEAPRFENFDTGIILLNVKLLIDNKEDEAIPLNGLKAKLTVNNGKQYMLQELMLSAYTNDDQIEPGEEGEAVFVFAMDKEQYEKIWKDKSFEFEYGPIGGVDTYDLSKGKVVEFELPQ